MANYVYVKRSNKPIAENNEILYEMSEAVPEEFKGFESSYSLHKVEEFLAEYDGELLGVVIDLELEENNNQIAINLAHYLLLSPNSAISSLPIIILSEQDLKLNNISSWGFNDYGLFRLKGAKLLTYTEDWPTEIEFQLKLQKDEFTVEKSKYLNEVRISHDKKTTSRHNVANQWGALRLAESLGFHKEKINYSLPKTNYFRALQRKANTDFNIVEKLGKEIDEEIIENKKISLNKLLNKNKILLVDDNAEKGWRQTLELIFDAKVDVIKKVVQFKKLKSTEEYDLVFVDLYMNQYKSVEEQKLETYEAINAQKRKAPHIPIILFTASNKSWTLEEVLENGADGMYVKESPDYAEETNYSYENAKSFLITVNKTLSKYSVLRPYWEAIKGIKNSKTYQSIFDSLDYQAIPKKRNSKLKERIDERFSMFYGLLKRGFEQTEFNKSQFYFSDYQLAFMTLWSMLNEISEVFYNKSNIQHVLGTKFKCEDWKVINTNEYLIKFDDSTLKHNVFINRSFDNYEVNSNESTQVSREIGSQIAFLIHKLGEISDLERNRMSQKLHKLNNLRNKLYLTHGADLKQHFYDDCEVDKRKNIEAITPNTSIKDLFEIIGFLLTQQPTNVRIDS